MSTYEWLLILHLVGAFLLAAGAGAATVLGIAQTRTGSPRVMATLARLSGVAEWGLILPGALVSLVFGAWLVDEAGYESGDAWIVAAYVIWVAAVAIGVGVLSPATRRLRRRADALVAEGVAESDELRREAAAPLVGILAILEDLAIVAFLYLMVAKPGA